MRTKRQPSTPSSKAVGEKLIPVDITTSDEDGAAGIQWDGKYFLVGYRQYNTMYRYAVHNGEATPIAQIQLQDGDLRLYEFWLHHDTLVADVEFTYENNTVAGFPYPAGSPEEHAYPLDIYPYSITAAAKPKKP